jgi:undecaprenyl diphosphate synthase
LIYWLYERVLERRIRILPNQICVMITGQDVRDAPDKIIECTSWCIDISSKVSSRTSTVNPIGAENAGIKGLTYHISTKDTASMEEYIPIFKKIAGIAQLTLHYGNTTEISGNGIGVTIAIGKSGREEITDCIRQMAKNRINPGDVDEKQLESHLIFKYTPDFVIKTGGDHLTDFLIWQSVYSELFFSDINWKYFRKVDFLRALRDYQARVRRFGR